MSISCLFDQCLQIRMCSRLWRGLMINETVTYPLTRGEKFKRKKTTNTWQHLFTPGCDVCRRGMAINIRLCVPDFSRGTSQYRRSLKPLLVMHALVPLPQGLQTSLLITLWLQGSGTEDSLCGVPPPGPESPGLFAASSEVFCLVSGVFSSVWL